jgi:hypothetical protein
MNKKLLSLYSLKFNPFSPEVPTSALWSTPSIQSFCLSRHSKQTSFLCLRDAPLQVRVLCITTRTELLEIISNGENSGVEFKRDVVADLEDDA